MTTKAILAALAGAVAAFLLGWLVFGMLMDSFIMENTTHYEGLMKNPPNMLAIFGFNLGWSMLLALIYSKWANISSFGQGLQAGLLIAFFITISINLMHLAFMNLNNEKVFIADVIVSTIFWGIIGGVIGMVLGMGKKQATT